MPQDSPEDRTSDSSLPARDRGDDFLAGIFSRDTARPPQPPPATPEDPIRPKSRACDSLILERKEHSVSRKNIDRDALNALYRLIDHGHIAYLVGGAVRDLMISRQPKDFDIATDATPRKVKRLFRNCRIIGRRFRLAHLHYAGGKIIEVATFRSSGRADAVVRDGEMIRRDNVYGSAEEDAHRRDLTINGLFYDVSTFSVIDYVGGVEDLRASKIRMIGDPHFSFREDPIRMFRAIRHGVRIGFQLDQETGDALEQSRELILRANPARLLEELYKDLHSGYGKKFFEALRKEQFLQLLIPALVKVLERPETTSQWHDCLARLDEQVNAGHRIPQALGIAALVSPLLIARYERLVESGERNRNKISGVFRQDLAEVLRQLKVYRRDEERLWAALGGLCAVADAVQEGEWSQNLKSQPWLLDSMVVLYVLLGPGQGRQEMLEEARKLPVPESPERQTRGRRPRRKSGQNHRKQAEEGRSGAAQEHNGVDDSGSTRRRRRRRRRKPSRSRGDNGPNRS